MTDNFDLAAFTAADGRIECSLKQVTYMYAKHTISQQQQLCNEGKDYERKERHQSNAWLKRRVKKEVGKVHERELEKPSLNDLDMDVQAKKMAPFLNMEHVRSSFFDEFFEYCKNFEPIASVSYVSRAKVSKISSTDSSRDFFRQHETIPAAPLMQDTPRSRGGNFFGNGVTAFTGEEPFTKKRPPAGVVRFVNENLSDGSWMGRSGRLEKHFQQQRQQQQSKVCNMRWNRRGSTLPTCKVIYGCDPCNRGCMALYDTGASISIISMSQMQRVYCCGGVVRNFVPVSEHNVHVVNASEDVMPIKWGAIIVCQVQGRLAKIKIMVMEDADITEELIIGTNVIEDLKLIWLSGREEDEVVYMDEIDIGTLQREKVRRRAFLDQVTRDTAALGRRAGVPFVNAENLRGGILYTPVQGPYNDLNDRCAPLPYPHRDVHNVYHALDGMNTHLVPIRPVQPSTRAGVEPGTLSEDSVRRLPGIQPLDQSGGQPGDQPEGQPEGQPGGQSEGQPGGQLGAPASTRTCPVNIDSSFSTEVNDDNQTTSLYPILNVN